MNYSSKDMLTNVSFINQFVRQRNDYVLSTKLSNKEGGGLTPRSLIIYNQSTYRELLKCRINFSLIYTTFH